jgi:hypothetical protein
LVVRRAAEMNAAEVVTRLAAILAAAADVGSANRVLANILSLALARAEAVQIGALAGIFIAHAHTIIGVACRTAAIGAQEPLITVAHAALREPECGGGNIAQGSQSQP